MDIVPKSVVGGVSNLTWVWENFILLLRRAISSLTTCGNTIVRSTVGSTYDIREINVFFYPVDATTGTITIYLPSTIDYTNKQFCIKKIDSSANAVTIACRDSNDRIDGLTSISLPNQYEYVTVISDGSYNWWEIT